MQRQFTKREFCRHHQNTRKRLQNKQSELDSKQMLCNSRVKKYPVVFRNAGLDATSGKLEEIAELIRKSAIREQLIAALDDWAIELKRDSKNDELMRRVLYVSRRGASVGTLASLRQPKVWRSQAALEKLAASLLEDRKTLTGMSPQMFTVISYLLDATNPLGEQWRREAQRFHPDDFWINIDLGVLLQMRKKWTESAGFYRAAIAIRKNSSAAWNNLGIVLDEFGQLDAAVKAHQQAVHNDSKIETFWYNLGLVLYKQRKWRHAVAAYKEGIRLDETNDPLWSDLGNALIELEQFDEAEDAYRKALKNEQNYLPAKNGLALVLVKKGKLNQSLAMLQEALRVLPDEKCSEIWANIGIIRDQQKRLDEAVESLQKAVKIDAKNARAWVALAVVWHKKGNVEQQISALEKAVEADQHFADAWEILAIVFMKQRSFAKAAVACEKAFALKPKDAGIAEMHSEIYINWGAMLAEQQQFEEAILRCKRAVEIQPANARAQVLWGECLSKKKEWKEAISKYEKALDLDPRIAEAYVGWGRTLYDMNRLDEALSQLIRALKINKDLVDAHVVLGRVLIKKRSFDKAVWHCQRAIEIDPKHRNAHVAHDYWGVASSMHGKLEEGIAHFKKAIAINPNYAMAHFNYGKALCDLGRFDDAVVALRMAIRKNPKDVSLHGLLGAALGSQQRWREVHQATEKALAIMTRSHPQYAILLKRKNHTEQIFALERTEKPIQIDPNTASNGIRGKLTKDCPKDVPSQETMASYRKAYVVRLQAGKNYLIDLKGSFDTFLRIEDDRFRTLLGNDDVQPPFILNSRLVFSPPEDGVYKVIVTSFKAGVTGEYTLTINSASAVGKPRIIKSKLLKTPKANQGKFYQKHKFELKTNQAYLVELTGNNFDSVLVLFDATGRKDITWNNNVNIGTKNSRIDYTPAKTGMFTVLVTSYLPRQIGSYTLRVQGYALLKKSEKP